jgi:23S rRNA U2552 (ribose-2'-O)-methylase RlmE/FtsJ
LAIVEAKDVLGFQIPTIDTQSMAIVSCVEQLKGNILDESVVSKIAGEFPWVVQCVVHDVVGVTEVLHDVVEGDNARMSGCDLVQTGKSKIQKFC